MLASMHVLVDTCICTPDGLIMSDRLCMRVHAAISDCASEWTYLRRAVLAAVQRRQQPAPQLCMLFVPSHNSTQGRHIAHQTERERE